MIDFLATTFYNEEKNISLARNLALAFLSNHDFRDSNKINEIKSVVAEMVSNAVNHAYDEKEQTINLSFYLFDETLEIIVTDHGKGIKDIEKATDPMYSTKEGHTGLGFTIVEVFSDSYSIESEEGRTRVKAVFKI